MKKLFFTILSFCCVKLFIAQTPNLQWAKQFGGINDDKGYSVAVDPSGNIYTIGAFNGTVDFDPGPGTYTLTAFPISTNPDMFICKLDAVGNFIWAKQIGGTFAITTGNSLFIDNASNLYITGGLINTADFDPGPGTYTLTPSGYQDIFVSKFDAFGNLIWAKLMGGFGDDTGRSIKADASGNVYTTGYFKNTADFDPSSSTYTLSTMTSTTSNTFISKLDPSGNFVWAKQLMMTPPSNTLNNVGNSLALDGSGNVYTCGNFNTTVDFDPGPGTFTLSTFGNSPDVFISKLDASGNFVWAKQIGGNFSEYGSSITIDALGNLYTTGYFMGTADFDPGPTTYTLTCIGPPVSTNIFISKLDPTGNFVWAKQMGGSSGAHQGMSISVDGSGNVYTCGIFENAVDFDPGIGSYILTCFGILDVFVSKLDALGNFVWAQQIGGTNWEWSYSLALDANANVYTTGCFNSAPADFDPGPGTYTLSPPSANYDAFLHKISQGPLFVNESLVNSTIKAFPNPTGHFINISREQNNFQNSKLEIINSIGQTVLKSEFKNQIDVSELASGFYTLLLKDNSGSIITKKFVKE